MDYVHYLLKLVPTVMLMLAIVMFFRWKDERFLAFMVLVLTILVWVGFTLLPTLVWAA